ncbi:MAG: lipoate-protein ligase, lipoate-protein ligase A [Candidatus Peregrinibacteria bacterium GW2011_GWF2_33_10]|nr:MAG: lipoate-protein ligase, lipoate-protein ligase A [Candidatus Peregrinibacteria bacterium GW2011_GWF2_33_10]OGJ45163.1 MAG: lipoate--protein ligase [Candidatus Peregrinibacteria bacterium RIFOXYA12_FULL_33_12]OGJ45478.1 MAG: lipoate--protein ligase [Candidatus Peregrinibacteria bacterium RIFOXYA2_FULL_33_21]OGJ51193.1 MAG: lipoate--protein ligase [Candidatus Peregrinibacteria bacterium RIFOXYB2_FULL_33_20]
MSIQFRLLKTGYRNATFNMAFDEILIKKIKTGKSLPVLRFYGWKPQAVSIGYFQSLKSEIDEEKAKELAIDIVRRQTGGGAVFHADEITYSIHIPLDLNLVAVNILESYKKICGAIIKGLKNLKINAEFAPLNDILVNGQKISGNAQTRKQGIILQHGTILKSVDVDKMFEILKVPNEKLKGKLISDVKQRVTSISQHCANKYSFDDVVEALTSGFVSEFTNVDFVDSFLTDEEEQDVLNLAKEKYSKNNWNYMR